MAREDDPEDGDVRYLDIDDLINLNRALIQKHTPNEQCGVFNQGALEGAQNAPSRSRYYDQTNDLILLGAVLFVRLIRNHPFYNANKRTALVACRIFLLLNGAQFDPPLDDAVDVARSTAMGEYNEQQVASWISWYTRPVDCMDYISALTDMVDKHVLGP